MDPGVFGGEDFQTSIFPAGALHHRNLPSRRAPSSQSQQRARSITDHRTHDVPNLFLCDGSSFVTSGRNQPTLTIQALAYRAADRITRLAKSGALTA